MYSISIISNNGIFNRICIIPDNINQDSIKSYLAISLYIREEAVEILTKKEVYVLDNKINET